MSTFGALARAADLHSNVHLLVGAKIQSKEKFQNRKKLHCEPHFGHHNSASTIHIDNNEISFVD